MYGKASEALAKARSSVSDEAAQTALYACATVGAWTLAKAGGDLVRGVWKHFLRPRRNLRARYGSSDPSVAPWAVVTGGADGIGLAYCQQLAEAGFNLCVIDKDAAGEAALAKALPLLTELVYIQFDFANLGSQEGFGKLESQLTAKLAGKDVAVLVNNVAEFQHQDLVNSHWSYILRASHVNAHSYAAMARHFLPGLLARASGGVRSAVINVGTCAAEPQNPRYRFTIYGATKAYTHIFSSSLREMYSDKLDVMTVIPRQVETKMNPAGFMFTIQPATHAKAVIDQLGYEDITYGAMTHCLEYQMRYRYTMFGMFDKFVQWRNASRNAYLVKVYDSNQGK